MSSSKSWQPRRDEQFISHSLPRWQVSCKLYPIPFSPFVCPDSHQELFDSWEPRGTYVTFPKQQPAVPSTSVLLFFCGLLHSELPLSPSLISSLSPYISLSLKSPASFNFTTLQTATLFCLCLSFLHLYFIVDWCFFFSLISGGRSSDMGIGF